MSLYVVVYVYIRILYKQSGRTGGTKIKYSFLPYYKNNKIGTNTTDLYYSQYIPIIKNNYWKIENNKQTLYTDTAICTTVPPCTVVCIVLIMQFCTSMYCIIYHVLLYLCVLQYLLCNLYLCVLQYVLCTTVPLHTAASSIYYILLNFSVLQYVL